MGYVNLNLTLDESSIVFSTKTTDSMHYFIFYKLIGNFEALGLVSGIFPGVDLRVMSSPPSRTICFFLLKQPSFSLRLYSPSRLRVLKHDILPLIYCIRDFIINIIIMSNHHVKLDLCCKHCCKIPYQLIKSSYRLDYGLFVTIRT